MTPDERAKRLIEDIDCHPNNLKLRRFLCARAIRDAENEALERAAQIALDHVDNERSDFGMAATATAERIADAIRDLKGDAHDP